MPSCSLSWELPSKITHPSLGNRERGRGRSQQQEPQRSRRGDIVEDEDERYESRGRSRRNNDYRGGDDGDIDYSPDGDAAPW